jgi:Tfp pilus assembly pilus retraction ATPase PilT
MNASLFPWIEEARCRGALTLHLAVGSVPRVRIEGQLHPLTCAEAHAGAETQAQGKDGALSAETIESFVQTIVSDRLRPVLDREGEGEFSFTTMSGDCLNACIYRCRGCWSIVVHLSPASQAVSGPLSSLIP